MSEVAQQFEELLMEFTKQQSQINEFADARSKLETQYQENKIVLDEFDHLDENSKIYKMTGPVLMPQDYNEAKTNVSKRIEYIQSEIQRVEDKIESTQQDMEKTRDKLLQVRSQMAAN